MGEKTKRLMAGKVQIGGGAPVSVQSMTNTKTKDADATAAQINRLAEAGCQIVRVAVPDEASARAVALIKERVSIPVVADIHFDYRLAVLSAEAGADKIRINPGNIGGDDRVKEVARVCSLRGVPIRVGVNGGSLEKHILKRHGAPTAEALAESALYHKALLNRFDFDDICLSVKSSSVPLMVRANLILSERCECPLHLGVTETGTERMGLIKSAAGIGGLLCAGVGDTIRVSLTADPVREIFAADMILRAVGLRRTGANIIACPTCGRTNIDLIAMANEVERRLENLKTPLDVAVMGCAVNGPGEASQADIGIAGGDGCGVLFVKGRIIKSLPQDKLADALIEEIISMTGEDI